MAKKKSKEEEEDELDALDELESQEIESVYPTLDKEAKPTSTEPEVEMEFEIEEEGVEEGLEEEIEFVPPEPEKPTYKYLDLEIHSGETDNDYEVIVKGQSHGFCNVLVKHLLDLEKVSMAAYKSTDIHPSKIYLRLENGSQVKKILHKAINSLKDEVEEAETVLQKLF